MAPRGGPWLTGIPQVDRLRHSLMKAEEDCTVERRHTLKLRHAMEQRPSQELLWELQQEKALLQARVRELEASMQVGQWAEGAGAARPAAARPPSGLCHPQDGKQDEGSHYIQVLEEDWQQALRDNQERASTIFSLRKELRRGEAQRIRVLGPNQAGWAWPARGTEWGWRACGRLRSPIVHGGEGDVGAAVPGPAEGLQDVQGPH